MMAAMDPVALILLIGLGGVVASVVSMRRAAGEGAGPRLADGRSVMIGGALILGAAVVAVLLLSSSMR